VTLDQLTKIAKNEFGAAIADMKRRRGDTPAPQFTLWRDDMSSDVLPMPEELHATMGHGKAKDELFAFIREGIAKQPDITGFSYRCEAWMCIETAEGNAHRAEFAAAYDTGLETLVKRGWLMRCEGLVIIAQSREDVVLISQPFQREPGLLRWLKEPETKRGPQSGYAGRSKMWGDPRLMGGSRETAW